MIPATQNDAWGFWNAMGEHAPKAWPLAMKAIAKEVKEPLELVRIFLDSRQGRHFADDVHLELFDGKSLNAAITVATKRWMGWTINKWTSKQYGIPQGLPYLVGFVLLGEIEAE
jgi:hypothetical protein